MREVAAVASRVRSRFRSWIKHLDSSISQDSDFMHQQDGSFFLSRVVYARNQGRYFCLEPIWRHHLQADRVQHTVIHFYFGADLISVISVQAFLT